MLRKTFSALSFTLAAALSIGSAFAQGTTTIDNLPAATAPLQGNESIPIWQDFHTRKATPLQLSAILAQVTAPANPFQFQLWEDTSANPAKLKQFDGTQWVVIALLDTSAHLSGVMNPSALPGGVVATAAQANKYVSAINTDGTVTLARPLCANLSDAGNICPKSTGKSVGDPGGGVIESLFNAQAVTGTNRIFTCVDMQKVTRRSNSGSAMADNFPDATATTCLTHGAWAVVDNIDATAVDVVTAGIGTAFGSSGAATDTVEPGRFVIYTYDLTVPGTPRWRKVFNSGAAAVFDATGSNVSGDLVSLASAYGKVHDSGVLASQVVISTAGLTNGRIVMGTTNAQGVTSLGSAGTTITVLHGNASGLPTFGPVALGTDVSGTLPLANGGFNNSITASNGGILWSDASKINLLAGNATAGKVLQSGASATPAWSTSTYPAAAGAAGHVPRSNATNYVDAALGAADLSDGVTGTGNVVRGTGATIGTPAITGGTISGAAISGGSLTGVTLGAITPSSIDMSGSGSPGVKFPSTEVPSADPNTIDDYQEGQTCPGSPAVGGSTTAGTVVGATIACTYVKVGRLVTVNFYETWTSASGGAGALAINNFPFTPVTPANPLVNVCASYESAFTFTASTFASATITSGANQVLFKTIPVGGGSASNQAIAAMNAGGSWGVTCTFQAAN